MGYLPYQLVQDFDHQPYDSSIIYTEPGGTLEFLHTICHRGDAFRIARARRVAEATRGTSFQRGMMGCPQAWLW